MNGSQELAYRSRNYLTGKRSALAQVRFFTLYAGMTRYRRWLTVIFLLFGCMQSTVSQSIYIKATIDRDNILIGEPIRLQLEASVPLNTPFVWFPADSMPHFEVIEASKIDTAPKADHIVYRQVVTITSFDSGSWVVPALPLEANDKFYLTDSLPVTVSFSDFNPSQDYHDIKDIVEVTIAERKYINWIIGIITLLAVLTIVYLLRRKKKKPPVPAVPEPPVRSPIDEALQQLEELQAQRLPERGEAKLYYTRLTDILRSFIFRRMNVTTAQKTSEELILQLKQMDLPPDQFTRLAQTLRMSDAVKFAKYVPPAIENNESFDHVKTSIELINNIHP